MRRDRVEGGFGRHALGVVVGMHARGRPGRATAGRAGRPWCRSGASGRRAPCCCNWPMVRMPSRSSVAAKALPTPQIIVTGCVARKLDRLRLADDRKAARLAEVGGDLGEELAVGQPDRNGDADLLLDARARIRPARSAGGRACSRSVPARSRKASSIESGSTSGVSSCIMARTSRPTPHIFLHVGLDDDRLAGRPPAP